MNWQCLIQADTSKQLETPKVVFYLPKWRCKNVEISGIPEISKDI